MPSIVVAGCNHKTASRSLLERLSVSSDRNESLYRDLRSWSREALVLSTCNRTELYVAVAHTGTAEARLPDALGALAGVTTAELTSSAYVHTGADAVRHAFMVASGLDSLVLGEDQILSQWKRALDGARKAESLGPVLDRLGSSALACGKRVRAFTGVGRHSVSIESLAVRAAGDALRFLGTSELLVIGAGESAALVVRSLVNAGASASRIVVLSRTHDRAKELTARTGARAAEACELEREVARADAIFCCASVTQPLLAGGDLAGRTKPLVCVDLGTPRNLHASVSAHPQVRVIDLDALVALAEAHRASRREHVPVAESHVNTEVARFLAWKAGRGAATSVARLQAHGERIANEELATAMARLARLDDKQREVVASLARRIVKRLMHSPSVQLKNHPEGDNLALAVEVAFGLQHADAQLRHHLPPTRATAEEHAAPSQEIA